MLISIQGNRTFVYIKSKREDEPMDRQGCIHLIESATMMSVTSMGYGRSCRPPLSPMNLESSMGIDPWEDTERC